MDLDDLLRLIQKTSIIELPPDSAADALRVIRSSVSNNTERSSSAGFSTVTNSNRAASAISNFALPISTSRSSVSIFADPGATKKIIPFYFIAKPSNDKNVKRKVLDDAASKKAVNERDQERTEPLKHAVGGVTTFSSRNNDLSRFPFDSSDEETPRAFQKVNTAPQQLLLANSNATTAVKSVPINGVHNKGTVKKNSTYGLFDSSSSDDDILNRRENVPFGKNREPRNQNENTTKIANHILAMLLIPTKDVNLPTGKIYALTLPAQRRCSCTKLSETKYITIKPDNEEYQIIVDEMNNTIRKHVSGSYNTCDVKSIKKIKNCCLWMRFMNRQTDIKKEHEDVNEVMLFHGSMACDEICKSGFDERHSNQGGMFGAGVYFAKHSSKSNQYVFGYMGGNGCPLHKSTTCTTCLRKMLLCRVELGNSKKLTSANKMSHAPPGFHSVSGVPSPGGLLYDKFVIYRGDQAYPEYEITYTIK